MGSGFWQVRIRFQASGCAVVQAKYGDSHGDLESHKRASTEETAFLPRTKMAQMSLDSILLPQPRSLASWTLAQILNAGNWPPVSSGTRTALALKYSQLSFPVRMKASGSRYLQTLTTSPQLALHLAYLLLIFGLGYGTIKLREAMDNSIHRHYHPLSQGTSHLRLLGKTSEDLI